MQTVLIIGQKKKFVNINKLTPSTLAGREIQRQPHLLIGLLQCGGTEAA